jgi:hypothetical protein
MAGPVRASALKARSFTDEVDNIAYTCAPRTDEVID